MIRFSSLAIALVLACNTPPSADDAHATPKNPAAAPAPTPEAGADGPAATVGGTPIAMAEVDRTGAAGVIKARQDLYEARKMALDQIINKQLFEAEAKAKGMELEAWTKAEINDKITPVSEAEVAAFYQQNQAQMRGAPLDQVAPKIKGYLEQQQMQKRMVEVVDGLRAKADVVVFLDPPRIAVEPGDSPRLGNAEAPIQIIEFSDFQCPYCSRGADTIHKVEEKYGDKVSVVYRHFPLSFHPNAAKAAEASECANDQGKFWEFHDQLFANQSALELAKLSGYATAAGLDVAAFDSCLSSGKHADTVKSDMEDGEAAGMSGTPGFYINGRFIGGAQPIEVFSEIIDDELRRNG